VVSKRCPHCYSFAAYVACVTCNRDMCEDCISYGEAGKVCGLCRDREGGYRRWQAYRSNGGTLDFDEWYDKNA
jgi:hypothetical protein